MNTPEPDQRSPSRCARDEQIAAEPNLKPLDVHAGGRPAPLEAHLTGRARHPVAVEGVVENGLVRPLDPKVTLAENSRVIIVAKNGS